MRSAVAEIARISQSLPPRKKAQLLHFARALQFGSPLAPLAEPKPPDAQCERIINDPKPRPKLAAKLKQLERLAAQGMDEPMDRDRL
jgi:hypothetical protein